MNCHQSKILIKMKKETIIILSVVSIVVVVIIAYMVVHNNTENQKYAQSLKDSQTTTDKIHYLIDLSISNNPSFKNCYVVDGVDVMVGDRSNMKNCDSKGVCQLIYAYCPDTYCKDLALYCAKKIGDTTLFRDLTTLYEG